MRRRESRKSPNLSVSVATHVREGKRASRQQVGGEYKYIQTPIIGISDTIGIADLDDFDYSDNEGDIENCDALDDHDDDDEKECDNVTM